MNELQRTEYLTALGVTSYMPRFRLPQAPPPRQALLPPALVDPSTITAVQSSDAAPALSLVDSPAQTDDYTAEAAGRPIPSTFEQLRSATAVSETAAVKPVVVEVAAAAVQVPPFVLSCWWLGDELLAVDSREPGTALPLESLFSNIVRALGWHQLTLERDRLRWPMSENRFAAAADASDARDTCSSWLQAACSRKPVKSIWLMGREARDFCSPVPLPQSVNEWQGVQLLALPSLSQLLQAPARKRELWQLLQNTYLEQTRL